MQKIQLKLISTLKISCIGLLLFFSLACQNQQQKIVKISREQLPIDKTIEKDVAVDSFIAPYRNSVNETMNEVLAYNKNYMVKSDGKRNTAIGNMMADIVLAEGDSIFYKRTGNHIDMVLLNHGGIRAPMQKGDITRRTAFEIMPFENEIVVTELRAETIQKMLVYLENAKKAHPVAGVQIELDANQKVRRFLINQQPIDAQKTYFVATSDYLKNGGDRMYFFEEAKSVTTLDYKIRNAIIYYFQKVDTVDYKQDNRFIIKP